MKIAALVIGGILVAAMVAFTASVIASTVALLANPVTWIILAIIAAVALLAIGIYELVTHWGTVWGFIKRISLDVWHWMVDAWHATWNAVMGVVHWAEDNIFRPMATFFERYIVGPMTLWMRVLVGIWEFTWGFLSVVIDDFRKVWDVAWAVIKTVFDTWWAGVRIIFRQVDQYGITPTRNAIHALAEAWDIAWSWIKAVFDTWWAGVRIIFGYVSQYGIQPLRAAISWLGSEWDRIWNGIKAAVSAAWNFLRPILDRISGAISSVVGGIRDIANAPGKFGSQVAHMFGFDAGGWVPGPPGAPQLAVVHGGEYVLSRDMISSVGRGPAVGGTTAQPGMAAALAPIQLTIPVIIGGRTVETLHLELIPAAQRYKARTGTTGMT